MEGFLQTIEKAFGNRYFTAIKKSFILTLPLILAGSIASLINNLPVSFVQSFLNTPAGMIVRTTNGGIWLASTACLALIITISLGYFLAQEYKLNPIMGALTAFASYISICATTEDGGLSLQYIGAGGLFSAMIITAVSIELYHFISCWAWNATVDVQEIPEIGDMFLALVPMVLSVVLIASLNVVIGLSGKGLNEWLYTILALPFSFVKGNIAGALSVVFGVHIFWFFGIHGANVMDEIVTGHYLQPLADNAAIYAQTGNAFDESLHTISKGFLDVFVYMGGAGTTLCIIIALFFVARNKYLKTIGRISGVFSIFNMNELMLFGLPVILNPLMFIPFVGTPLVLTLVSWGATEMGLVAHAVVEGVSWATPPILSGYLITGGHVSGALLQVVNIAIGILIYLPFVKLADRRRQRQEQVGDDQMAKLENTLQAVVGKVSQSTQRLNGDLAGFSQELKGVTQELTSVTGDVNHQMELLRQVTCNIEDMSGAMQRVGESVETMLNGARQTLAVSQDGTKVVSKTTQQMDGIYEDARIINKLAETLQESTEQIRGFLATIEGIAAQTNILSLNATIEAARAGEAGKGFAVVASEIKTLSHTSQLAVNDITQILQRIEANTDTITNGCHNNQKQVEEGRAYIQDTSRLFEDIRNSIEEIKGQSGEVATAAHGISAELENIKTQIYTTNEVFEATAEKTNKVTDKVLEKTNQVEIIAAGLNTLDNETSELARDIFEHQSS